MIRDNLDIIRENIKNACLKCGRDEKEITLLAVSKTKPYSMIEEAKDLGLDNFGENKVQELDEKRKENDGLKWHMIGHLQTNKVKKLLSGEVELIHSVDSVKLAKEINKVAHNLNKNVNILIEVNISNDPNKSGVLTANIDELIDEILHMDNLNLKGLMTIPMISDDDSTRKYFRDLNNLEKELNNKFNLNMDVLSMGMSNDYELAIEEGSTIVRIGTNLFGKR